MSPVYAIKEGVAIAVLVVTGSARPGIEGPHGDFMRIRVAAAPQRGRANEEASSLLAEAIGLPVALKRGMSGRRKVFVVAGADVETVRRKLGA